MRGARVTTERETDAIARRGASRVNAWAKRTLNGTCPAPGLRTRSRGRGRGLARGKGRGPLGIRIFDRVGGY